MGRCWVYSSAHFTFGTFGAKTRYVRESSMLATDALAIKSTAPRKEIFAWAMYDFANSGYTTVVLTAVFNTYFVGVIAGSAGYDSGAATLLWTIAMAIANALVLISAPLIGAIADHSAMKKRFLAITTLGCVTATAALALCGPGDVALAMALVAIATLMFASGENLIAAFLPELTPPENMGRISAYGWSLGYVGGLIVLGACLAYVTSAQARGETAAQFIPITMLIVAATFALASLPTFFWLKERAIPNKMSKGSLFVIGFRRVAETWRHARQHRNLFRFLLALAIYQCGINTVIVLAGVYAQEVMHFATQDTIMLILVVNVTAAVGAFVFGRVQDRLGSKQTLAVTLLVWIGAMFLAYFTNDRTSFWVVANLVGLALGASQSAGRAIVGILSPPQRSGEFFGLWGLATKLAAIIGPLSYGLVTQITHGNHRLALLSTTVFFVAGLAILFTVRIVREPSDNDDASLNVT